MYIYTQRFCRGWTRTEGMTGGTWEEGLQFKVEIRAMGTEENQASSGAVAGKLGGKDEER